LLGKEQHTPPVKEEEWQKTVSSDTSHHQRQNHRITH
jgi:hypothetical protein